MQALNVEEGYGECKSSDTGGDAPAKEPRTTLRSRTPEAPLVHVGHDDARREELWPQRHRVHLLVRHHVPGRAVLQLPVFRGHVPLVRDHERVQDDGLRLLLLQGPSQLARPRRLTARSFVCSQRLSSFRSIWDIPNNNDPEDDVKMTEKPTLNALPLEVL